MRSTETSIALLVEAYGQRWGQPVRISDLAVTAGLSPDEAAAAVTTLLAEDAGFRAEPEPFTHRITAADRQYAVVIGGEARHLICWID